jgi:hypothetical protein
MTKQEADSVFLTMTQNPRLLEKNLDIFKVALAHKDWVNLIKTRNITDIETAVKLGTPSLSALRNYRTETYALTVIIQLIKEVLDNLNINGSMNDSQIGFAARDILANYYFLRLSELRFCFLEGLRGSYGIIYDRIDLSVLTAWLKRYDIDRLCFLAEKERLKGTDLNETGLFLSQMPKEVQEKFKLLGTEIEAKTPEHKDKLAAKINQYCALKGISVLGFIELVQREFEQQEAIKSPEEYFLSKM